MVDETQIQGLNKTNDKKANRFVFGTRHWFCLIAVLSVILISLRVYKSEGWRFSFKKFAEMETSDPDVRIELFREKRACFSVMTGFRLTSKFRSQRELELSGIQFNDGGDEGNCRSENFLIRISKNKTKVAVEYTPRGKFMFLYDLSLNTVETYFVDDNVVRALFGDGSRTCSF